MPIPPDSENRYSIPEDAFPDLTTIYDRVGPRVFQQIMRFGPGFTLSQYLEDIPEAQGIKKSDIIKTPSYTSPFLGKDPIFKKKQNE
jgi:hypothetical protein